MTSQLLNPDPGKPLRSYWRDVSSLLSSMRFAVMLLVLVSTASVIGTVVKQHEPAVNYVNQFGPFWAQVFSLAGLYSIYSSWWFLLVLAFLLTSTGLCLWRNTPKFLRDVRLFKESVRVESLRAFPQHTEVQMELAQADVVERLVLHLRQQGWKFRAQERNQESVDATGLMLAAKRGGMSKWGYISAHAAIILICLGGLLDSDLLVRAQTWFAGKEVYQGAGLISQVSEKHRLPLWNPSYRGNVVVAENTVSGTAVLNQGDGVLLQDLPFAIELKKFQVDYYSTGMPKLFASDVVLHDLATGEQSAARVEVNHPAQFKGVQIYQSSFQDGGSTLDLEVQPVNGAQPGKPLLGKVGTTDDLSRYAELPQALQVEYSDLRVINVETMAQANPGTDAGVNWSKQLGAATAKADKQLRNIGPSVTYKLRDTAGQAVEFQNYMAPVQLDDGTVPVYLFGLRDNEMEGFRFLRVPTDTAGGMESFWLLRRAQLDPELRLQAVRRYVDQVLTPQQKEARQKLQDSAMKVMALFAGDQSRPGVAGLQMLSDFIEHSVPEAERSKAGDIVIRILNGSLLELQQIALHKAGKPALDLQNQRTRAYMTQAVVALSDLPAYKAPYVLVLKDYHQVQASVFQVTRSPGKTLVYLGCLMLVLGVLAMLYIRDRRLWLWVQTGVNGKAHVLMAYSGNRKTLLAEQEYAQWCGYLREMVNHDKLG